MKLPFHLILNFAHRNEVVAKKAFSEFFGSVGFASTEQEKDAFPLFAEWLIFDFRQSSGLTFLQEYVLRNPDNLDGGTLNKFESVAKTHFFGGFEIQSVKRGEWIRVEHLFSGKKITIYDKEGSQSIPEKGSFAGRVAQVSGKYYLVGSSPLLFPTTFTPRMKKMLKNTDAYTSPKDVWKLLQQQADRHPSVPSPTKKDIKNMRKRLKKDFMKLAQKHTIKPAFQQILDYVNNENDSLPDDYTKDLIRLGIPQAVLIDHIQLFQDIWNYFPHKALGGKSPAEMITDLRKEK